MLSEADEGNYPGFSHLLALQSTLSACLWLNLGTDGRGQGGYPVQGSALSHGAGTEQGMGDLSVHRCKADTKHEEGVIIPPFYRGGN